MALVPGRSNFVDSRLNCFRYLASISSSSSSSSRSSSSSSSSSSGCCSSSRSRRRRCLVPCRRSCL